MSKSQKNTSLNILYVLLLIIVGFQNSSSASINKLQYSNLELEIEEEKIHSLNSALVKSTYSSSKVKRNAFTTANQKVLEDDNKIQLASQIEQVYLNSTETDLVATETLLMDASFDFFTDKNPEDHDITIRPNIALDLIRKVSLFFFLLFFIPFGVFYPFFLMYKKLLSIGEDSTSLEEEEIFEDFLSTSPPLDDLELSLHSDQATISKLQVAFLPKIINLKQQLEQASLNIDKHSESEALDLMRSAISIFITQQDWTHASFESLSFSSEEAQKKFGFVLSGEQDKCIDRKLSAVNVGQQKSENYIAQDTFRYTVVTMVFYTAGSSILFGQIDTKENLAKLLIDLSQINEDDLLKFELIWNPLEEEEFITNEQLLVHYEDMVRLF